MLATRAGMTQPALLARVFQRAPAVPGFNGDPGADAAPVALPVRTARVMPGQAVDVGQVGVVAPLLDVADDADVGVPVAFIEHVERTPGIVAHVLQPFAALVHVHQNPALLPLIPGGRGDRLAAPPQGRDDRRVRLAQQDYRGLGKRWFRHFWPPQSDAGTRAVGMLPAGLRRTLT